MNIAVHTAVMAATMHNNNVAANMPSEPLPVWAVAILLTIFLLLIGALIVLAYKTWKL